MLKNTSLGLLIIAMLVGSTGCAGSPDEGSDQIDQSVGTRGSTPSEGEAEGDAGNGDDEDDKDLCRIKRCEVAPSEEGIFQTLEP